MVIFYKLSDIDLWSIIYMRGAVKSKLYGPCTPLLENKRQTRKRKAGIPVKLL